MCVFYKSNWLIELNEPDSIRTWSKAERKRFSRYIYASGLKFSKEPPFCRYGYICECCYEINKCWYDSMITDDYFKDSAHKYLMNMRALRPDKHPLQLNLFNYGKDYRNFE